MEPAIDEGVKLRVEFRHKVLALVQASLLERADSHLAIEQNSCHPAGARDILDDVEGKDCPYEFAFKDCVVV